MGNVSAKKIRTLKKERFSAEEKKLLKKLFWERSMAYFLIAGVACLLSLPVSVVLESLFGIERVLDMQVSTVLILLSLLTVTLFYLNNTWSLMRDLASTKKLVDDGVITSKSFSSRCYNKYYPEKCKQPVEMMLLGRPEVDRFFLEVNNMQLLVDENYFSRIKEGERARVSLTRFSGLILKVEKL